MPKSHRRRICDEENQEMAYHTYVEDRPRGWRANFYELLWNICFLRLHVPLAKNHWRHLSLLLSHIFPQPQQIPGKNKHVDSTIRLGELQEIRFPWFVSLERQHVAMGWGLKKHEANVRQKMWDVRNGIFSSVCWDDGRNIDVPVRSVPQSFCEFILSIKCPYHFVWQLFSLVFLPDEIKTQP